MRRLLKLRFELLITFCPPLDLHNTGQVLHGGILPYFRLKILTKLHIPRTVLLTFLLKAGMSQKYLKFGQRTNLINILPASKIDFSPPSKFLPAIANKRY